MPPRQALPILIALSLGCTADKSQNPTERYLGTRLDSGRSADTIRLATFNIEWLTADPLDGDMRRNDVDHAMITELIEAIDPDVMVLQEVEGDAAMALLDLPGRYAWETGNTGWSQNVVIMWHTSRVSVTGIDELDLPSTSGASKEPLTAKVSVGALTLTVVGIHHAAFDDIASARERRRQAEELVDWVDDTLPDVHAGSASDNVAILGDFNDTFEGINTSAPSLDAFEAAGFVFATKAAETFSYIHYQSLIDHVALSPDLAAQWSETGEHGGCQIETHDTTPPWSDYSGGYRDTQNISDHRPVWIDLVVPR